MAGTLVNGLSASFLGVFFYAAKSNLTADGTDFVLWALSPNQRLRSSSDPWSIFVKDTRGGTNNWKALINRHTSSIIFFIRFILLFPFSFSQWLIINTTPACGINATWRTTLVSQTHSSFGSYRQTLLRTRGVFDEVSEDSYSSRTLFLFLLFGQMFVFKSQELSSQWALREKNPSRSLIQRVNRGD